MKKAKKLFVAGVIAVCAFFMAAGPQVAQADEVAGAPEQIAGEIATLANDASDEPQPAPEPEPAPEPVYPAGWNWIDTAWYYYNYQHQRMTGWMWDGAWYFLGSDGAMHHGWFLDGGTWYYATDAGQMLVGWQWIGGAWYYLGTSGAMYTGWAWDGAWYYLGASGAMALGSWVDGGNYYVLANGRMAYGCYAPGGYWLDWSGRWMPGDWLDAGAHMMLNWAQAYSSDTEWLILVDTTSCRLGLFWGCSGTWCLYRYCECSPGAPDSPTITGTFHVTSKVYHFGEEKGYTCYYATQFFGDYLIHSILYNKNTWTVQDGRLGSRLSHGCVRVATDNALYIYNNCGIGTTVVTY